jgi:hypothetical protein
VNDLKKQFLFVISILLVFLLSHFATAMAQTISDPKTQPAVPSSSGIVKPEPPLTKVPEDRLINPKEGIGKVKFGMSIDEIEKIIGRGEIQPDETDFVGNTTINLVFNDKELIFKFFNGDLAMIIIDSKEYATKTGVHVGGSIGDAIREYGTDFRQEKSIVQDPNPDKLESEIFFDKHNIAFKCIGRLITKIRLKSPLRIKGKPKK